MIARLRAFCRDESLGIVIPAGVAVLLAVWSVLEAASIAFVAPILEELFGDGDDFEGRRLDFTAGDMVFDWTFLSYEIPALLALIALIYYVFVRPIPEESYYVDEDDVAMRECPECASEIVAEARRCPFCTAVIEPLADPNGSTA